MRPPEILEVDPRELRLRPSQSSGADPYKLHRQIARFGSSMDGMPLIWVYRGSDGALMVYNGITRATRIAKLLPGVLVRVEVVGQIARPVGQFATIGESLS